MLGEEKNCLLVSGVSEVGIRAFMERNNSAVDFSIPDESNSNGI